MTYLSVCACCGYDAPYLVEWIEFHRLVGVERFFLYNNGDREGQRALLAPFVREGTVVLHEWPGASPQVPAFDHCLETHGRDARWIAFIDTDEFLFSPLEKPLPELLGEYEEWPGVGVCRVFFGTSGHRAKPPGLVLESYLRRFKRHRGHHAVKSIVDPSRALWAIGPHIFAYREGWAVDEQRRRINGHWVDSPSVERLRINHYWTKSEHELEEKFARPRPDTGEPYGAERTAERYRRMDRELGEPDEVILSYLPALRRAVGARNAGGG
jgi:hypothetical protein